MEIWQYMFFFIIGTANQTIAKAKSKVNPVNVKKLKKMLLNQGKAQVGKSAETCQKPEEISEVKPQISSIAASAKEQLESSHFRCFLLKNKPANKVIFIEQYWKTKIEYFNRFLNQRLYTVNSSEAWDIFQEDPHAFKIYHKGYQNQVAKWPVNPLDLIIADLQEQLISYILIEFFFNIIFSVEFLKYVN